MSLANVKPWYKHITDSSAGTVIYNGYAEPGTALGAAGWLITRQTITGAVMVLEHADSDRNFDNVWDDRATLTYG